MFSRISTYLAFFFLSCSGSIVAQGVYDYGQPETLVLQQHAAATAGFPKGIDGRPDWVGALKRGLIEPRATLRDTPRTAEAMGAPTVGDIVFANTQFMPHVVFPHQPHLEWLACANCHDALFERRATGQGQGMNAILQGRHCGFCHGRVAFSPEGSCYRCHSKPNPTALQNNSPFVPPTRIESAPVPDNSEEGGRRRRGRPMPGGFTPYSVVPAP